MQWFQAILLGVVQGITEFFPISSSAHLKFARYLMGLPDSPGWVYFDLSCHAGTWFALCYFLRKEIWQTLRSARQIALFSLALTPLIPAYFFLKPFREALSQPHYTGYFLLATALLLFFSRKTKTLNAPLKWGDMVSIGMMQSFALLPGLSRSGSTIAAARFRGLDWTAAARCSFLLAVPTILGGEMLESWKLMQNSSTLSAPLSLCAIGMAASFVVGLGSVRLVFRIYERQKILPFVWYCALFGLLLLAVFRG